MNMKEQRTLHSNDRCCVCPLSSVAVALATRTVSCRERPHPHACSASYRPTSFLERQCRTHIKNCCPFPCLWYSLRTLLLGPALLSQTCLPLLSTFTYVLCQLSRVFMIQERHCDQLPLVHISDINCDLELLMRILSPASTNDSFKINLFNIFGAI